MATLLVSRLLLAVLFCLSAFAVTAFVTDNRQQMKTVKRSFAGMDVMCQLHRRNCPGGFRKRLADVNEGEALGAARFPQAPVVLPPLSQLLQAPPRRQTMGMMGGDHDGVREEAGRIRLRLVAPIRDAIISLLQRHPEVFSAGR